MFLGKGVLKIRSKFEGEHPCRSAVLIKLHATFEIALLADDNTIYSCNNNLQTILIDLKFDMQNI